MSLGITSHMENQLSRGVSGPVPDPFPKKKKKERHLSAGEAVADSKIEKVYFSITFVTGTMHRESKIVRMETVVVGISFNKNSLINIVQAS